MHDHAVVVVVDKLSDSQSRALRVPTHRNGAQIHRARCLADGPSPQKGRRCSSGAHRAASGPRRARRSSSLFAVLRHMYRKCVNEAHATSQSYRHIALGIAILEQATVLYRYSYPRGWLAYPFFERSQRPRNVCGRFGRATASTEKNQDDSLDGDHHNPRNHLGSSSWVLPGLHATIQGTILVLLISLR